MLKTILSIFKSILFFVVLIFATIAVSLLLPASFSFIHIGVVSVVLFLMKKEKSTIVWYMTAYYFCIELLMPSYVYGSLLFAGVLSTLTVYWIHRFFFTNRSVYTGMLLGVVALLLYRVLWFLYIGIATLFAFSHTGLPDLISMTLVYELLATETVLVLGLLLFRIHTDTV